LDHLYLIKDGCTQFKLAKEFEDEVKRKLLHLSLDDEARVWMRSINKENILD
jgi:hypothetical protein